MVNLIVFGLSEEAICGLRERVHRRAVTPPNLSTLEWIL